MKLFQLAAENWPEDEACGVFDGFKHLCADESPEYAEGELKRDCEHFKKVFGRELDGEELYARFIAKIEELKKQFDGK